MVGKSVMETKRLKKRIAELMEKNIIYQIDGYYQLTNSFKKILDDEFNKFEGQEVSTQETVIVSLLHKFSKMTELQILDCSEIVIHVVRSTKHNG